MKRDAAPLVAEVLDGLSVPALLCRADAAVLAINGPAGALLAPSVEALHLHPAGELLGCVNALVAGCGHGPGCATCPVRLAIRRAAGGERVEGVPVAMELVRGEVAFRLELLVSAEPVSQEGRRLALVTLVPIEWVA